MVKAIVPNVSIATFVWDEVGGDEYLPHFSIEWTDFYYLHGGVVQNENRA